MKNEESRCVMGKETNMDFTDKTNHSKTVPEYMSVNDD